jgi:hypothetical protein
VGKLNEEVYLQEMKYCISIGSPNMKIKNKGRGIILKWISRE